MTKMQSIVKIMGNEHGMIVQQMAEFFQLARRTGTDKTTLIKMLEAVAWEVEKHLLIEEREIFSTFPQENLEDQLMIHRILKDHQQIMDELNHLKSKVKQGSEITLQRLRTLWNKHEIYEKEIFYPRLDSALSSADRDELIKRINTKISEV